MYVLPIDLISAADELAERLDSLFKLPLCERSPRHAVCQVAASLAMEHGHACRKLLAVGMVPSGAVVLRSQYEALVRAIWTFYAASDAQIDKLAAMLAVESEQNAKNLPTVAEMMLALADKAPKTAYDALSDFKENSWRALNSFVHAGIHPVQRHAGGYPVQLVEPIFKSSGGLSVMAGMQAAVVTGLPDAVQEVGRWRLMYANCLPPPV